MQLKRRMFFLTQPSDAAVREILSGMQDKPFSYRQVGITKERLERAPRGFRLDAYGVELGQGEPLFERARALLGRIDNYPPSFTRVVRPQEAVAPDMVFAPVASHLGFYSVHPCRVIYVIDEQQPRRYGFGFGTLKGHAESGEERFMVTLDERERVTYEVQAFSRPIDWLARLGAPLTRAYQLRFQRETLETMRRRSR